MRRPNQLRKIRRARGWSQVRLSVYSGVSLATIQKIECEYYPSAPIREKLRRALGVSQRIIFPSAPDHGE